MAEDAVGVSSKTPAAFSANCFFQTAICAADKSNRIARHCKAMFMPVRCGQNTCSYDCSVAVAEIVAAKSKAKREKAERIAAMEDRKIIRLKKESTRRLSWYADKAQASVNAYRRAVFALEAGEVCISCGKLSRSGKYHAGHFIPRNREPALRFAHLNIWLQCYSCNVSKSGNQLEYRKALMARADVGQEAVAWLEGPHEFPRLRQDDYRRIESDQKQLLKALKA